MLTKIETHGLSVRGHADERLRDHYAIADLSKSLHVHQSNLSFDDDSRLHGSTQAHVFVVADEARSKRSAGSASSAALDGVVQYLLNEMPWYHLADGEPQDVVLTLYDALENARQVLSSRTGADALGIDTGLTLAFVSWPDLYLAQIGRGRCFRVRQGELTELTRGPATAQTGGEGPAPLILHATLDAGDLLALLSESAVAARTEAELAERLTGPESPGELCARVLAGQHAVDRTAVLARFVPRRLEPAGTGEPPPPGRLSARRDSPRPRRPHGGSGRRWRLFGRRRHPARPGPDPRNQDAPAAASSAG